VGDAETRASAAEKKLEAAKNRSANEKLNNAKSAKMEAKATEDAARKEVAAAESELEAAQKEVGAANEGLSAAKSANVEAEEMEDAAGKEVLATESELEAAQIEMNNAVTALSDADEAVKAGETMLTTAEGGTVAAEADFLAASAAWEGAGFCVAVTGGGCASIVIGVAVAGSIGWELYSLKESVDTVMKSLTKSEATLEKLEEAFKQTVAFSKLHHIGITNETWTDMSVLLMKQHNKIQRMSGLIKDTIAQVINADAEYDASVWCSWIGWFCGSRIPDKALADLNKAQSFLDSWNDAVKELAHCVNFGPHSSNSCSTKMMSSIKAEKTKI